MPCFANIPLCAPFQSHVPVRRRGGFGAANSLCDRDSPRDRGRELLDVYCLCRFVTPSYCENFTPSHPVIRAVTVSYSTLNLTVFISQLCTANAMVLYGLDRPPEYILGS